MKLREFGSIIFIAIVVVSAGYAVLNKIKPNLIKDDNKIEEFLEAQLCDQLGIDDEIIDLTPDSKE